jgi:hypothetical protein
VHNLCKEITCHTHLAFRVGPLLFGRFPPFCSFTSFRRPSLSPTVSVFSAAESRFCARALPLAGVCTPFVRSSLLLDQKWVQRGDEGGPAERRCGARVIWKLTPAGGTGLEFLFQRPECARSSSVGIAVRGSKCLAWVEAPAVLSFRPLVGVLFLLFCEGEKKISPTADAGRVRPCHSSCLQPQQPKKKLLRLWAPPSQLPPARPTASVFR